VQNAVVELAAEDRCETPKDVEAALRKAYASETDEVPKMQLKAIIDNIDMAIKGNTPMCQDTGSQYSTRQSRRTARSMSGRESSKA